MALTAGLSELKSTLRSLVVSSPTQVDMRSLLRDYRAMMGEALPIASYGYRDPLLFLRERCGDCFLFQGTPNNPTLILIVPDQLKHIDEHVRRQKAASTKKATSTKKFSCKQKRASVSDNVLKQKESLIVQTFKDKAKLAVEKPTETQPKQMPAPAASSRSYSNGSASSSNSTSDQAQDEKENVANHKYGKHSSITHDNYVRKRMSLLNSMQHLDPAENDSCNDNDGESKYTSDSGRQTASSGSSARRSALEELKAQVAQLVRERPGGVLCTDIVQLYRCTVVTGTVKRLGGGTAAECLWPCVVRCALRPRRMDIAPPIHLPRPLNQSWIISCYKARYGSELQLSRCGLTSVLALLEASRLHLEREPSGEWRAIGRAGAGGDADGAAAAPRPQPRPLPRPLPAPAPRSPVDVDDALPGVDFDPDVFPADCVHFMESVGALGARAFAPGEAAGVAVGEVYSPSHFWLIRLGDEFNIAMEDVMDEMNEYYGKGPGKDRVLALGAVRPGHYCASVYDGDWHRSIIVRVLDCDTVKVRHIDYGTVERVPCGQLRPLLRRWGALPAQAVRARLAGVRPGAGGRRWPPPAAAAFLRLVRDKHLVAAVQALDTEEDVVEVVLVDTTTATDVVIGAELVRLGHADAAAAAAPGTSECYLFPRFEALESGATPNFAEIHAYLRDGIALECVDEYRRHVPAALPPLPPPPPPPAPAPAPPGPPARRASGHALPLMRGPLSHSDKAIQMTPPLSPPGSRPISPLPPTPPPSPGPALIEFSPPHSPTQKSATTSCTSLVHSLSTMHIAMSPPNADSSSTAVASKPSQKASDSLPSASVPSMATSVTPPRDSAPSSAASVPSSAAPAVSCPVFASSTPVSASEKSTLSPAATAFAPGTNVSFSRGNCGTMTAPANRPTQTFSTTYRQPPPRFMPPVHVSHPLVYPQMMPPQFGPPPPQRSFYPGPYPYPPGNFPPPPPYSAEQGGDARRFRTPGGGSVTLSVSECEIFRLLSHVDPHAAHWYMVDALSRAMGTRLVPAAPAPRPAPAPAPAPAPHGALNPDAREFRHPYPQPPQQRTRPPPGFEDRC